ncbi:uncharacterized protein LOC110973748 [Acanthaster planci]|uniref:Uncharacterized protein LOC110973748 n=1 Tax=Acanthaster planci TaxID=133434 RepID=A0A8B7XKM1_ACAPL|nr:uncharacterized protein LOC110973748 [Acanthaster planci]XP_022080500.1 uncharacterized protein LOC110973748 [Acanthaster planci]
MASSVPLDAAIPCPVCNAKEVTVTHSQPLEVQNLNITLPSTGETISFQTATETFIREHYPDLNTTTYRVPSAFFYDHKGDLDLQTNEDILNVTDHSRSRGSAKRSPKEVVKDRFQKDAVEKVVRRFHTWGAGRGEGMLILSEYKIQDYLRLATRAAQAGRKNREKLVGDHDVMVIHFQSGVVVFVQVKSVQETSAWKTIRGKLKNAWEQTIKDEAAFRELNADIGDITSKVPVLRLVALPELSSTHLTSMAVCDLHTARVLTKEILGSASAFDTWLSEHLSFAKQQIGEPGFSLEEYTQLCGRYVGLASVVRIRTLTDAVKKASAKTGKILLTPDQREIITTGNRRQIIMGEYGTGKSLVLAKMAERIVGEDKRGCTGGEPEQMVFIVSCTGVSHTRTMGRLRQSPCHLVAHLRSLISDQSSSLKVMSVADLFLYCFPECDPYLQRLDPAEMAQLTRKVMSLHPTVPIHILWDEVPFVPKWDWTPLKDLGEEHPETFIWLTIATGTYISMDSGNPTFRVSERLPGNFTVSLLTRCMRMTRNGFNFYRALQDYLGDKGCSSTTSGNAVPGCIPLWYPMEDCVCKTTDPLKCTCIEARLTRTLKRVWGHLKDINPSQVSIVVRDSKDQIDKFLFTNVKKACECLNIPSEQCSPSNHSTPELKKEDSPTPKCQIVDIFSYKGCESPVVIFVTSYGWPLVWDHHGGRHGWDDISPQISRALGQIILISWPNKEMDHFSRDAVLNMISSYSDFPLPVGDEEAEFLKTMIGKFEEVLTLYSRDDHTNYLDILAEKGVLMKCWS